MKFRFTLTLLAALAALLLPCSLRAQSAAADDSESAPIYITFAPDGEATTVET